MSDVQYDWPVPSEEYEAIIRKIAKWCSPYGRKQELARKMKVSHSLVSLWISGKRPLSLEDWIAIKKIIRRRK